MIITVTLNPAIDKTLEVDNCTIGSINRVSSIKIDAGGKGINVSKVIKNLKGESIALGALAGSTGEFIKNYLDTEKIKNDFIFSQGETRTNVKIVDKVKNTNTDINEPGNKVSGEDIERIREKVFKDIEQEDILVLSGSVPQGVGKNIYEMWIKDAKKLGVKTILDADGELLKQGILSGPYLIKPNIHELEMLFDVKINGIGEVISYCKKIFNYGVNIIAVSLGSEGALFMNGEKTIYAHGLKVEVKSTVGAGDSMVAALAFALDKGYSFERSVTLSVAAATAGVMTEGTTAGDLSNILSIEKQVVYEYL
ncbi:1-phosphofructokinase [Clostridium sp. CS001]|uniref:1-phosphofructokinase n=1 Tax=Clostridium sp. CS001 TaxID=2880648 RepID=UPI001CF4EB59|nr:1-phosphofructokinase [Clostridium sp. CS001]MCB2291765.1 1-phosphofructokinase [Clostridium sp. CS001]